MIHIVKPVSYTHLAILDLPDATRLLKALRARKALQRTKVLAVTRNNSHYSMGGQDAFILSLIHIFFS